MDVGALTSIIFVHYCTNKYKLCIKLVKKFYYLFHIQNSYLIFYLEQPDG